MNDSQTDVDVLIVGGGFTGITAARELVGLGARVRVVDSYDGHSGGRAFAYDPQLPGVRCGFDHGAEYVGDLQNGMMAAIRELLPEGTLVNGAKLRVPYPHEVMILDQRRFVFDKHDSALGIAGVPPQVGFLGALGMIGLLAEMSLIEWSIDVVEPWNGHPMLLALDEISIWDWLEGKSWVQPVVKDLLRISVEALLSVEPTQISPYYLLWYTACNGGFLTEINDGAGGPQQYWLLHGASQLAERWAEPVADRITRGVRVERVDLSGDPVVVDLSGGERVRAKKVLVATSPRSAARSIQFVPDLPPARRQLLSQPMGRTLKCQVFYASDWWHDSNGHRFDGYAGGANYPILWVMDNSPPGAKEAGGPFVLMTFTVGDQLDALGPNPTHERIVEHITTTLRDIFGDERALAGSDQFVRLVAYRWDDSEGHVGGGPNTIFEPGVLTGEAGRLLNEPWDDKVFFASAENALNLEPVSKSRNWELLAAENLPQYTDQCELEADSKPPFFSKYSDMRQSLGYMDGAMVSGRWVAHRIARSLGLAHHPGVDAGPAVPREAPPEKAPHAPADIAAVVAAVRTEMAALAREEIAGWSPSRATGRGTMVSWLRGALIRALGERGLADTAREESTLASIRDFVAALVDSLSGDDPDDLDADHPRRAIRAEVEAAESLVKEPPR